MSDDAPPKKEGDSGAPAWVMTFADLMSLLMCFFVLLLSFSEMDLSKYKQVAGSMKNAFGVQREIKTMDMPKGTSIIAREFSPGRPSPTVLNVVKQNTIDDTKQTLEFTDAMTEKKDGEDMEAGEEGSGSENAPVQRQNLMEAVKKAIEGGLDAKLLENFSLAANTDPQTAADAAELLKALSEEVRKGIIEVGTEGQRILIRIREKGSFPSGSATFRADFLPVLDKLRQSLKLVHGRIVIAGHTDNVPINTARFRSNWELSTARGVSVIHELLKEDVLESARFVVEGHGDAHPLAPNDTWENRALNRRVELTIVQGEGSEANTTRSADEDLTQAQPESDDNPIDKQVIALESPLPGEKTDEQQALVGNDEEKPVVVGVVEQDDIQQQGSETATDKVETDTAITADDATEKTKADKAKVDQKALEERIKKFSRKMEKLKE